MFSKIQLISNAMVLLGGRTVADLDEDSTEARIASSLYDTSYATLLTSHRWRFNTKQAKLARLNEKPIFGYSYVFQLPTDLLYLIQIDSSVPYEIYEDTLHINSLEVSIDYQYKIEEASLPAYFAKTLEFYLAMQFAIPLTGDDGKANIYSRMYEMENRKAKFNDSTQSPTPSFKSNPYIEARY